MDCSILVTVNGLAMPSPSDRDHLARPVEQPRIEGLLRAHRCQSRHSRAHAAGQNGTQSALHPWLRPIEKANAGRRSDADGRSNSDRPTPRSPQTIRPRPYRWLSKCCQKPPHASQSGAISQDLMRRLTKLASCPKNANIAICNWQRTGMGDDWSSNN